MTTLREYLGDDESTGGYDKLVAAWRAFEAGTADRDQAARIIYYLSYLTAYYESPTIIDWINNQPTKSAVGYEAYCIEHQARRRVFANILPFLTQHPDGKFGPTNQSTETAR